MNTLDFITSRRSIRKYTADPVSDQQVENLLRAAMAAPSAGNAQPWQFVVIRNRDLLQKIPGLHPYAQMAASAPVAILACADPALEKYPGYWPQDLSAAVENLLLAAHGEGLGAVWCGVYPEKDRVSNFRKLLNIPESIVPFALISLGFPAEEKSPVDRFDTSRVHLDRWGGA